MLARYTRKSLEHLRPECGRILQQRPFPFLCCSSKLCPSFTKVPNHFSLGPLLVLQGTPSQCPNTPFHPEKAGLLPHKMEVQTPLEPQLQPWDHRHKVTARSCLSFIGPDSTGGHQPHADSSSGSPSLSVLHRQTEASTLEPSWQPGHLWDPGPELEAELQLQDQLGPWFEPCPWPLAGRA